VTIEINDESQDTVDQAALLALSRFVLDHLRIHPLAELSIRLVDQPEMARLHEKWMDESGPTDVMAFPMDELRPPNESQESEPGQLGDVVLCPAVAEKQALQAGHSAEDELHLLCTHGILHLLGFDHHDPDEKREMFALQATILAAWQGHRFESARS
jgi:probable rRNA maturation factor